MPRHRESQVIDRIIVRKRFVRARVDGAPTPEERDFWCAELEALEHEHRRVLKGMK